MNRSGIRRRVGIPATTTQKSQTKDFEFVGGIDSNSSNDDVSPNKWVYATDVRQVNIGKWETRRGSLPMIGGGLGSAYGAQITSTTGAGTFSFSTTTWFFQKVTLSSAGRASGTEVRVRNTSGATGTPVVAIYSDAGGNPGTELVRSTIPASSITGSYQFLRQYNVAAPDVVAGDYWIVLYVQPGGTGSYEISTTTSATTAKTSTNSGATLTSQSYAGNVKLIVAPAGKAAKGVFRVKRPSGTVYTFMAYNETVYIIDEFLGTFTNIDSSLDPNCTAVRFDYVNDKVRYVQVGVNAKPHFHDFTGSFVIVAAPENAHAIINHVGVEFFASSDDTSKVFWTNFGEYEKFTSTDFLYVPAPKTGDPVVGFSKLNGFLYIHTRNNKYQLSGRENATFQLDNAIGQKGTFSQESLAYDEDYVFLASDDGIYQFNGAEEKNICVNGSKGEGVQDWWDSLTAKDNTVLEVFNNRLYVFYTPNGESQNSRCRVYNTLYRIWESDDTRCYVGATFASADTTGNYYLQASNRIGIIMYGEYPSNDYNMLGEPLSFELHTAYNHYDAPAQMKYAPYYRPHFDTVSGTHSVTVGYATDYSNSPTESTISLAGSGPRFNTGLTYDSGVTFGSPAQVNPMDTAPQIPGEWRRLQIRYSHEAAREPVSFDGHILSIQTQRLA